MIIDIIFQRYESRKLWYNEKVFQTVWTYTKNSICVQKSTEDNK